MTKEKFGNFNYKTVIIGDVTLYVYKLKIISAKNYTENATTTRSTYITNKNVKASRIVLYSKLFAVNSDDIGTQTVYLENAMRDNSTFTFSIDNIKFTAAEIISLEVDEEIESGFANCSIIFITEREFKEAEQNVSG